MAGTGVQQDVGGVKSANSNQTYAVPATTETGSGAAQSEDVATLTSGLCTLQHTFCVHERRQK